MAKPHPKNLTKNQMQRLRDLADSGRTPFEIAEIAMRIGEAKAYRDTAKEFEEFASIALNRVVDFERVQGSLDPHSPAFMKANLSVVRWKAFYDLYASTAGRFLNIAERLDPKQPINILMSHLLKRAWTGVSWLRIETDIPEDQIISLLDARCRNESDIERKKQTSNQEPQYRLRSTPRAK